MGSPSDHRLWSQQNADLARTLAAETRPEAQRWAVIAAYYAVMDALQAVAAEHGEPRDIHPEIIEIPADLELPGQESLEKRARELYNFCNKARYLRGENTKAHDWFMPYARNPDDLVDNAIQMMESVLRDL